MKLVVGKVDRMVVLMAGWKGALSVVHLVACLAEGEGD